MQTAPCLVFDVGGTKLRAGLYESDRISREMVVSTPNFLNRPDMLTREIRGALFSEMQSLAGAILHDRKVDKVSIAFAGPIDSNGSVLAAPTIWGRGSGPYPLREEVQRLWPEAEVSVLNDVTAAGYRYLRHPSDDICVLTVSSGIGHKIFVLGRPVVGPNGRGGEIGHLRVDTSDEAPVCDCGEKGHVGAVASGRGVLLAARKRAQQQPASYRRSFLGQRYSRPSAINNAAVVEAFHAGDRWVHRLVRESAEVLGRAIAMLHCAVGLERVVVIGGFALALGDGYRRELARAAGESCWNLGERWDAMVCLGEADDWSGMIGAGRYAMGWSS
jgi:glucokinase